jgi:glucose-1-phosphate thymidylyltransferase
MPILGLSVFHVEVCDLTGQLTPSARGELEITDFASRYRDRKMLHVEPIGRGFAWLDTGTYDRLLEAAEARGKALSKTAYGRAIPTAVEDASRPRPFAERRAGDRRRI